MNLEPMYQAILNTIQLYSPLNKYELIHHLARKLETRQDISGIIARYQKLLIAYGLIRVEEFKQWKERTELEKDRTMNAMIVPSGDGGFALKIGVHAPFGRWPDVEAARDVLRRSNITSETATPEMLHKIAAGEI